MSTYRPVKDIAKTVRESLKKEIPSFKFSVTTEHYSHITVALMSGPVPVFKNNSPDKGHAQLNPWHIEDERLTVTGQKVMAKALAILNREWWDRSEPQTDYFCCAFYRSLDIGKWDRPYVVR